MHCVRARVQNPFSSRPRLQSSTMTRHCQTLSKCSVHWPQAYSERHGARSVRDALDAGCSAGQSSRSLAERLPHANVTGLDLSPHFLAIAEHRERCA